MRFGAAAVLVVLAGPAAARSFAPSERATTSADFLGLGAGARAAAMGGAYSALVDDAAAVYWNPAAMTLVGHRSLTLMHASLLNASSYEYASYVQNEGRMGAFGIGAQYYAVGRLVQTDQAGTPVGTLTPYDLGLTWSYAHMIGDAALGVSAKIVDSRIINSASAGAADVGFLFPPFFDGRLRLALTALNLGGDTLVYDQTGAKLPLLVRAGSAFEFLPTLRATLDVSFPRSDQPYGAAGAEWLLHDGGPWVFAARAGFSTQTVNGLDGFSGVSMGFGVAAHGASVDYGFVPYGGLGQAHRLSLTFLFR